MFPSSYINVLMVNIQQGYQGQMGVPTEHSPNLRGPLPNISIQHTRDWLQGLWVLFLSLETIPQHWESSDIFPYQLLCQQYENGDVWPPLQQREELSCSLAL